MRTYRETRQGPRPDRRGMALACRHALPLDVNTLRDEVTIAAQSVVTASGQILLATDNRQSPRIRGGPGELA
jgi:hypothetical protein